ncbi:hypothetical protein E1B28_009928 [Marasmius oreades]|uniref:RRM domain-containing protein n=1 Tax=Marasmius oreades TaxID=181124 RepID=A0A9P7RX83_9AGAR|nr:uncharacterized protein E1B28_009928 [Marasmius oreades]KAG7090846.1 hypothetical protein E1B28_009928 [Marasmius oreades]
MLYKIADDQSQEDSSLLPNHRGPVTSLGFGYCVILCNLTGTMSSTAKIYVGNLSWNTTDESLRAAFNEHGMVTDAVVMRDRDTGRSRGFGFVTFGSPEEANLAIANMHESDLDGRRIKVNLANARQGPGGGGGGGYNAGGGSGETHVISSC